MNQSNENKINRSNGNFNPHFINNRNSMTCSLCKDYFKSPVQCIECEVAFCKKCITKWYDIKNCCPKGCAVELKDFKKTPKCFNDIVEDLKLEAAHNLFEKSQNNDNHSASEICFNCKQINQTNSSLIMNEKEYLELIKSKDIEKTEQTETTEQTVKVEETDKKNEKIEKNENANMNDSRSSLKDTIPKINHIEKIGNKKNLITKTSSTNKINESSELSNLENIDEISELVDIEFNEPRESKKSSNISHTDDKNESERKDKNIRKRRNQKIIDDKPEDKLDESDNSMVVRSKKIQKKVDLACKDSFSLRSTNNSTNNLINPDDKCLKATDDSFKYYFNNHKTFKNSSTIKTDDECWCISSFNLNNTPIVVNGDASGGVNFWNVKNNILFNYIEGTVKESCNCLLPIIFDKEYEYIAAGCHKDINIYHIKTGKLFKKLTGHTNAVCYLLKIEIASKWYIASGSVDNTIIIWEYEKLCFDKILLGAHSSIIYCLERLCQDQRTNLLVSGSVDTTIKIWNVEKGTPIRTINNNEGQAILALNVILIENKEVLISGDAGGKIKMWDPINGSLLKVFSSKHKSKIWSIKTFELLGETLLVSGSDDGVIKITNPSTGNMIMCLSGHQGSSWCLTTIDLNDTIAIVSGSNDKTLKVWKLVEKKYA